MYLIHLPLSVDKVPRGQRLWKGAFWRRGDKVALAGYTYEKKQFILRMHFSPTTSSRREYPWQCRIPVCSIVRLSTSRKCVCDRPVDMLVVLMLSLNLLGTLHPRSSRPGAEHRALSFCEEKAFSVTSPSSTCVEF